MIELRRDNSLRYLLDSINTISDTVEINFIFKLFNIIKFQIKEAERLDFAGNKSIIFKLILLRLKKELKFDRN